MNSSKNIKKRFPATVALDKSTFLNDRNIDAELYALLQKLSTVVDGKTVVLKKNLPPQDQICEILGIKSAKTYRAHLNYLIEKEYVIKEKDYYYLPEQEDVFLMLPLETIQFLVDTTKESVIKTYIYLFQRYKWKKSEYVFTIEELGQHLGVSVQGKARNYLMFKNILTALSNNGLIEYESFFDGKSPRKRLLKVNERHKENSDG